MAWRLCFKFSIRKLMWGKKHCPCILNITSMCMEKEKKQPSITIISLVEYLSYLFLEMLVPTNKVFTFSIVLISLKFTHAFFQSVQSHQWLTWNHWTRASSFISTSLLLILTRSCLLYTEVYFNAKFHLFNCVFGKFYKSIKRKLRVKTL